MADVIVIGAGAAGLAAARALGEAGLGVLVLEARRRTGGRVLTERGREGVVVELGAEFVHGDHPSIRRLLEQGGLKPVKSADRHHVLRGVDLKEEPGYWNRIGPVLERLDASRDRPVSEFFGEMQRRGMDAEALRLARQYVAGFHAANPARMSERALAEAEQGGSGGGDGSWRVPEGFDRILAQLADGLPASVEVRLGAVVREIAWSRGAVRVLTADGAVHEAPRTVVTLPLGVLQAPPEAEGAVRFAPEPPTLAAVRGPAAGLAVGPAVRLVLEFDERCWPADAAYLHGDRGSVFPVWWTRAPLDAPLLTAWAGGTQAAPLLGRSCDTLSRTAVDELARLLGRGRGDLARRLLRAWFHDWSADPYTRGAYSYVAVGGAQASARLAAPAEDTLWFAGEALAEPGAHGTVHGALESGERAARSVLASRAG